MKSIKFTYTPCVLRLSSVSPVSPVSTRLLHVSSVSPVSSSLSQPTLFYFILPFSCGVAYPGDFYGACHGEALKNNRRCFSTKEDEKGGSSHNPSLGKEEEIKFIKPGGDNCFIDENTNIEYVRVFGK
jgi:hypothetical protein